MKRIYFTIIALIATLTISAQTIKVFEYDENGNLNNSPAYTSSKKVKVIFTEEKQDEHEWVDLGLPSGTLWATCNVGASKPEEYGDYFAWGEVEGYNSGKNNFSFTEYKHCIRSSNTLIKYCTDSKNGKVDNKTVLESCDDAATVNWGSAWCMPSDDQIEELINSSYTTTEWATINGVYGKKITSKTNGKTLFLPAAGYRGGGAALSLAGSEGSYWARSLSRRKGDCYYACTLYFYSSNFGLGNDSYRFYGHSVRPVRVK